MKLPLEDMVNNQQLLQIALDLLSKDPEHEEASGLLVWYILNYEVEDGATEEEIMQKYTELIISHSLKSLATKGLVEYDFESKKYSLTKEGLEIKDLLNENE